MSVTQGDLGLPDHLLGPLDTGLCPFQALTGPLELGLGPKIGGPGRFELLLSGRLLLVVALNPAVLGPGLLESGLGRDHGLLGLALSGAGALEPLAGLIKPGLQLPAVQGDEDLALRYRIAGADLDVHHLSGNLGLDPGLGPGPDGPHRLVGLPDRLDRDLRGFCKILETSEV